METISGATVVFPGSGGVVVAEGELTFRFPDEQLVAPAGTFVFVPRGIVHTAGNSGRGPMRGIIIVSPGEAEHIFEPAEGS